MKRIGRIMLVAAVFSLAACGTEDETQEVNVTAAFCDVCGPVGPQCEKREVNGTEMLCAKRPVTEVTVASNAPTTTTVATGGGTTTTTTPNPNPTPTTCSPACNAGQTCQQSGTTYSCVATTTVIPPSGEFTSVAFSRNGIVVTGTFTGLVNRHWRIQAGTDTEPANVPAFLLPVGGSGHYGWNSPTIGANSLAGRCQTINGNATCMITAVSNEPFTWQGCDRDPSVNNQGCGFLAWFKTDRLRVTGGSVNSQWNFVVP